MKKKSILFISHGVDGGIDKITSQLNSKLSMLQMYESFIAKVDPVYKLNQESNEDNVSIIHSGGKPAKSFFSKIWFWVESISEVCKIVKNRNPDIIVFSGMIPLLGDRNFINQKCKIVFWEHGPQKTFTRIKKIACLTLRPINIVISPTSSSLLWLTNNIPVKYRKSAIVHNWVDISKIKPRVEYKDNFSKILIMVCCRIDFKQKDFYALVEALKVLKKENLSFNVDVYGQGPDYELLNFLIKKNNLHDQVSLLGYSSNIYDLYKNYDLTVLPTKWEGFGLVLAESMSAGVPCITANVEGAMDVVIHGKTGLIYNNGDSSDLALKILEFAAMDRLEKNSMQAQCIEYAFKNFNDSIQVKKFAKIFSEL